MQVIATATGFYGRLIHADEIFEVPDDEEDSSWFVPTDPAVKEARANAKAKGKAKAKPQAAEADDTLS